MGFFDALAWLGIALAVIRIVSVLVLVSKAELEEHTQAVQSAVTDLAAKKVRIPLLILAVSILWLVFGG